MLAFTCGTSMCSCALTGKPQARDVQQIVENSVEDHREIVVDTSCYPRLAFQTPLHSVKLLPARSDQNLDQNYTSSPAGTGFVTPLSQPQMPATPASSQLPMTPASQQPTPAAMAPQRTRLPSSSWADMVDDDEEDGTLRDDPTSKLQPLAVQVLSDGQAESEPAVPMMTAEPEIPVEPTPSTCDAPKKASTLVQASHAPLALIANACSHCPSEEFNLDPNLAGFVLLDALETAIAENQPETMEGPPAQSEVVHAPTQTELRQQGNRPGMAHQLSRTQTLR